MLSSRMKPAWRQNKTAGKLAIRLTGGLKFVAALKLPSALRECPRVEFLLFELKVDQRQAQALSFCLKDLKVRIPVIKKHPESLISSLHESSSALDFRRN